MRGRKTPIKIVLTEEDKKEMESLLRCTKTPLGLAERLKVILMISEGHTLSHISRNIGLQRRIVRKWCHRFIEKRMEGLKDAPRSGRPPVFSP